MLTLAFYKAPGDWRDGIIRLATRSDYSHVEVITDYFAHRDGTAIALGYASSPRDGGVVIRELRMKPGHWDLLRVPWHLETPVLDFIARNRGAGYDWRSILFNHAIGLGRQSRGKWTCSELIGAALGFPRPWRLSPGDLYAWVAYQNGQFAH